MLKTFTEKLHMRFQLRQQTIVLTAGVLFAFSLTANHVAADVQAQKQSDGQEQASPASKIATPAEEFAYVLEGRPDPFVPFIQPKVATKIDPNEIVEEEKELTGMQLFEPGQLKLVAIMFTQGKKIAMVEDVTGAGYVLHEGILIGRNGVVSRINKDDVIITETAKTRAGKEVVSTVVMRLNKEGDQ